MNVFVLSTGRCGSETFVKASRHIRNYTAAHESHNPWLHIGVEHPYRCLLYPDQHIESDNRLSWFLGTLDKLYGPSGFYVHLLRRREEVAASLVKRGEYSILRPFAAGILQWEKEAVNLPPEELYRIGMQYWETVNDNIEAFLKDKPRRMTIWLHDVKGAYAEFWQAIGAVGDLDRAVAEWETRHNAAVPHSKKEMPPDRQTWAGRLKRCTEEIRSIVPEGARFILIDEDQWGSGPCVAGRMRVPFLEENGQYWGPPATDEEAIRELERLRAEGAAYLVVGWPAFWWLQQYPGLAGELRSRYCCVLQNDRIVIYDLNTQAAPLRVDLC
jgi:hypothetical protein